MSDEEKSIEEIIAELEGLEKEAKKPEQQEAPQSDENEIGELTLEEPREETPSSVGATQDAPLEFEDIFAEKPPAKPLTDVKIEVPLEELSLTDSIDEKPSQPAPSDDFPKADITLDEPIEGLSLEEPVVEQAKEDEGAAAFSFEEGETEKQPETGEQEISLESADISLEKSVEEALPDEKSFEEISLNKTDTDEAGVLDDQTVRLTTEDINLERRDDVVPGDRFDEKFDDELITETKPEMLSSGGPAEEPPDDEQMEFPSDEPPSPPPKIKKPMQWSRLVVLLGVFVVALISYGIFVWPQLYEYRWVKSGDVKYQVKINRITKTQHYFDAGSWHQGAVPPPAPQTARHKIEAKPAEVKSEQPVQAEVKEPAAAASSEAKPPVEEAKVVPDEKKAVEQPAPPAAEPSAKAEEKEAAPAPQEAVKADEHPKEEKVAVAVPVKEEPQEQKEAAAKPAGRGYTIQLSSMRLEEFADELVASLKKKGWPVMQDIVMDKNKEPWHRVFLGGFTTRDDAVAFMKENNIQKAYPGSYIRSDVAPSAAE